MPKEGAVAKGEGGCQRVSRLDNVLPFGKGPLLTTSLSYLSSRAKPSGSAVFLGLGLKAILSQEFAHYFGSAGQGGVEGGDVLASGFGHVRATTA